ncbi:MAG: type VI secretion system protein ImpL [Pseudohongiellaceae bacterium]|jgi:type VI secretion system protein ImpL
MKRILALLLHPIFLGLLTLIILGLAIWFGGEYIRIGDSKEPLSVITRLIIIMVFVLIWGANNMRIQLQKSKQNKKMLDDITDDAGQQKSDKTLANNNASSDEEKLLYSRFKEATDALKSHQFGGKKRRTIYELPWYLMIGPPGAGKTTVLANSGLQFPLKEKFGLQGVGGVGGTRNCDWWFTDDAVLIDTAGRYTTQDSHAETDRGAWLNFLALLKKYRPRRAINGAIVAVSLQELIMLSRDERLHHAETIRNRIQELMTDLNIRFPIYFVITKCDLMAGFNEFFEDLNLSDREQVWGVTFPMDDTQSQKTSELFDDEFDALVKRVNERLLSRLHNERDPYRRAKMQAFPSQFENMRGILNEFVENVFGENQYQTPSLLRGVYFTSGTQEGTPIDRILTSLSTHFGVQGKALASPPGQGKSFFIQKLLKEVIFPEANVVGINSKYEGKLRWFRRFSMLSALTLVLGSALAWTSSLNKNELLMEEVSSLMQQHQDALVSTNEAENRLDKTIAIIEPLNVARSVYDRVRLPWVSGLGLYDESVQETAHAAYKASLLAHFNPVLIKRLELFLSTTEDNDQLYDALRVYLMLADASRLEANEVLAWFKDDWASGLKNQGSKQLQLMAYLKDSIENGVPAFKRSEAIVQTSRLQLQKIPIEQRIYKQIERVPELRLQSDLIQAIGGDVLSIFEINTEDTALTVPFMFTKAGYQKIDLSKNSPLIRKYSTEQWILGTSNSEDFSDKDVEVIAKKVKDIYLLKYTEKWQDLLKKLSVRDISNTGQARIVLAKMSDRSISPLMNILTTLTNETSLTPEINQLQSEKGVLGEAAAALREKMLPPTVVDLAFKTEHNLIRKKGIDDVLATTKSVYEVLEGFSFAPMPNEAALKFSTKRFTGNGSDPLRKLLAQASKLPQPMRRWMEELTDQVWKTVLIDSKKHLNTVWKATVYQSYQSRVAGRYPFTASGSKEVAMLDFVEYFKPEGIEDAYVTGQLLPFIKKGKVWKEKSLNGRRLGIRKTTLVKMKKAQAIRNVFFRKNKSAASFNYKLKPYRMDSTVRRFELSLGEGRIRYSHGPKLTKSLSWPGTTAGGVRLLFEDINETKHNKRYSGDWAFFKALDDADVKKSNRSNAYTLTFDINSRKAEYELSATSALNPFSPGWLSEYTCPKVL